jgi:hypothetical protein
MSDLHDLLLAEAERIRPATQPPFEVLEARGRRRHTLRMMSAAATVIAVVVATFFCAVALRGADNQSSLAPARPAAPARPLISRGECRGLTVTATLPGHPQRWPIQQGMQPKAIAMPPNALMWLRARGPCVNRLRISATTDLIQTATAGVTTFNKHGIGIIVSHGVAGQATIELFYSHAIDQVGPVNKIATIPVTITRTDSELSLSPSPSP